MIHTFPAKPLSTERKAKQPLVMPAPHELEEQNAGEAGSPWIAVDPGFATPDTHLNRGIRLVLLALLDFFGGKPTRGDDPPGAEARPFKLETLDAIAGRRHSSRRSFEAAAAHCEEFPYAAAA